MKKSWASILTMMIGVTASMPTLAQEDEDLGMLQQQGPSQGDLGDIAEVHVPEGFFFTDGDGSRVIMELMQNPTSQDEMGFLAPTNMEWFLLFEFDEAGYISDDEKDSLDADAMLDSIEEGNEMGNKERQKRGWAPLRITGWQQAPRYNPDTHNLEWAVKAESEGEEIINWNTRLLGRRGVMKVTLVTDPESLLTTLPKSAALLADFAYKRGHQYAEFRKGDKIAKYGLSALVVGGATAVALKSGAFKWLWKVLVVAGVAVGGLFKSIFGRKKG